MEKRSSEIAESSSEGSSKLKRASKVGAEDEEKEAKGQEQKSEDNIILE